MKYIVALIIAFGLLRANAMAGSILITDAWSRPAIDTGVVYLRVTNVGPADTLTGARSPIAKAVELHRSMEQNDMSSMTPVASVPIASHDSVAFAAGGKHIMLIGLKRDLHASDTFPVALHFVHAGWVTTTVAVRDPLAASGSTTQTILSGPAGRDTEGVSQSSIILDAGVFVLGLLILGGILVYIGKRIFTEPS
jgi:copper(I)-binding protein